MLIGDRRTPENTGVIQRYSGPNVGSSPLLSRDGGSCRVMQNYSWFTPVNGVSLKNSRELQEYHGCKQHQTLSAGMLTFVNNFLADVAWGCYDDAQLNTTNDAHRRDDRP
jgi:hypothetical protein